MNSGSSQPSVFSAGQGIGSAIGSGLKSLFSSGDSSNPTQAQIQQGNAQLDAQPDGAVDLNMYNGNNTTSNMARGGKVPAMVSPGERYLPPSEVDKVAKGQKAPEKAGVKIPGKAKVKGDSLKNDTVPATLEEGGIVLPKSVMESANPHWAAHKFVSAIMAKKGGMKRG
jgi:hypothetical protein